MRMVLLWTFLAGCGDKDPEPAEETDADADSDTDADTDADSDVDPDDLDGDGFTVSDCDDADAGVYPGAAEDCGDGRDQDCDEDVDCADRECDEDAGCLEDCSDGKDNDGNGAVDCEDGGCAADAACVELCENGVDDDADGLIDCEDGGCAVDAACVEDCADGADDDGDGLADCADDDCLGGPGCERVYRTALLGGHARLDYEVYFRVGPNAVDLRAELTGITGVFQSFDSGGAALGSCGWTLDTARFVGYDSGYTWSIVDPSFARLGFVMESGCAFSGTSILRPPDLDRSYFVHPEAALGWMPFLLLRDGTGATSEVRWYTGALTYSVRGAPTYKYSDTLFVTRSYELYPASFTFSP